MKDVILHAISVCCIDMWSKICVLWKWFGDMDIAFRFSQPYNEKMALQLFVWLR
jgi:hypothetical protein